MERTRTRAAAMIVSASLLLMGTQKAGAGELFNIGKWFSGAGATVKTHHCDQCGNLHAKDGPCIERSAVQDCVVGKKKVYDCKILPQYVSIPETRYRWKKKLIKKKIPCPYCKPVCKSKDCQECYGEEKWDKEGGKCSSLHCKHVEQKYEKVPTKYCEHKKGETTITVHYWSCVKEPYTVYRRVRREVCVKEPRYERVEVPVTRYVCDHCGGSGCDSCERK